LLAAFVAAMIILLLGTFLRTREYPQSTTAEKIDYAFVNDPQAVGKWQSVDFVQKIENFDPAVRAWPGDLYLKELAISENGTTSEFWTWTKGWIINPIGRTAAKYLIKEIGGSTYMFIEWKSYDYATTKRPPYYYVLKKIQNGSDSNKK
jgi:bla regulator protein BlaR1